MPGLIRGVARTAVVAGTATAVSNRVSRRQANRWAAQEQPPEPEYAPPPQYAAPVPEQGGDMDAKLAQLKELGALRDQGVLSDYEFETQKRRILEG
jgi:hypothetical protein